MFNYSVKKTVVSFDVVIKLVSVTEVKGKGHVQREREWLSEGVILTEYVHTNIIDRSG